MYDIIYALVSLKVIAMTSDESRGINDPSYLAPASTSYPDTVLKGPPAAQLTSSPLRGRRRTGGRLDALDYLPVRPASLLKCGFMPP